MGKINTIEISPFKINDNQIIEPTPRVEDLCGNAEQRKKSDKGPDILNFLFDDPLVEVAKFCNGNSLILQVPNNHKCSIQRNK